MSWTLVKRLRVRRAASSEDMLATEDVLDSVDDCIDEEEEERQVVDKDTYLSKSCQHPNERVGTRQSRDRVS